MNHAIIMVSLLSFTEPPSREECDIASAVIQHQKTVITEMQEKHDRLKLILTNTNELQFGGYINEIWPYHKKAKDLKKTWRLVMWDERKRLLSDIEEIRSGKRIVIPGIGSNVRLGMIGTFDEKVEIIKVFSEKRFAGKYAGRTLSFEGWEIEDKQLEGTSMMLLGVAEIKESEDELIARKIYNTGELVKLVQRYKEWLGTENNRIGD